jgi:hypothetical protein
MVAAHVTGPKMEQAHSYYQKWALVGYAQWLAQLVNVCLQALLLTVSLLSIAYQRNVFSYMDQSRSCGRRPQAMTQALANISPGEWT